MTIPITSEWNKPLIQYYGLECRLNIDGIKAIGHLRSKLTDSDFNIPNYLNFIRDDDIHIIENNKIVLNTHDELTYGKLDDDWSDDDWKAYIAHNKKTRYLRRIHIKPIPGSNDNMYKRIDVPYGVQPTPTNKKAPSKTKPPINYEYLEKKNDKRSAIFSIQ
eukprot:366265_1